MQLPPISRRKFFALSGAALGTAAGFAPAPGAADTEKGAPDAINAFAADLYRRLADTKKGEKGTCSSPRSASRSRSR
jgi:hypothetical protein